MINITNFKEETLNLLNKKSVIIDPQCEKNCGVYGMVDYSNPNGFSYIGSTYSHSIYNRCIMYEQNANGGSIRKFTRGHIYDFVRTLALIFNNELRYDDESRNDGRKRYYLDYWWENGRPYNDGLINFFKITDIINSIQNLGYVKIIPIEIINDSTWNEMRERETYYIQKYEPYANMEFQLDEEERYQKHEKQVINVYDYLSQLEPEIKIPIKVTYVISWKYSK